MRFSSPTITSFQTSRIIWLKSVYKSAIVLFRQMIWWITRSKGGAMYLKEKLLQMLTSKKSSVRYEACEWIRVRQESSPEIVTAIEKATYDGDKEVAERAKLALQADVHHQMAIEMG